MEEEANVASHQNPLFLHELQKLMSVAKPEWPDVREEGIGFVARKVV